MALVACVAHTWKFVVPDEVRLTYGPSLLHTVQYNKLCCVLGAYACDINRFTIYMLLLVCSDVNCAPSCLRGCHCAIGCNF